MWSWTYQTQYDCGYKAFSALLEVEQLHFCVWNDQGNMSAI